MDRRSRQEQRSKPPLSIHSSYSPAPDSIFDTARKRRQSLFDRLDARGKKRVDIASAQNVPRRSHLAYIKRVQGKEEPVCQSPFQDMHQMERSPAPHQRADVAPQRSAPRRVLLDVEGDGGMAKPRARSQSWMLRAHEVVKNADTHRPSYVTRLLVIISWLIIIVTSPFSLFFCIKVIMEYERVVMFRLGRLLHGGARGPGIIFVLPCIDTFKTVDLRTVSFDVPPQEILSKDTVTVTVDAVVYFRVSDPIVSVTNVNDAHLSTKLLAQTALRNVLGMRTLSEMLSERESIAQITEKMLDEGTDPWGVVVERVEMKDIRLPLVLMRSMAAEAEAARDARAHIIAAEGERRASQALMDAATIMETSPHALRLRYLQTLTKIAAEHDSTVIYPVPINWSCIMGETGKYSGGKKRITPPKAPRPKSISTERAQSADPGDSKLEDMEGFADLDDDVRGLREMSSLSRRWTSSMRPQLTKQWTAES